MVSAALVTPVKKHVTPDADRSCKHESPCWLQTTAPSVYLSGAFEHCEKIFTWSAPDNPRSQSPQPGIKGPNRRSGFFLIRLCVFHMPFIKKHLGYLANYLEKPNATRSMTLNGFFE